MKEIFHVFFISGLYCVLLWPLILVTTATNGTGYAVSRLLILLIIFHFQIPYISQSELTFNKYTRRCCRKCPSPLLNDELRWPKASEREATFGEKAGCVSVLTETDQAAGQKVNAKF